MLRSFPRYALLLMLAVAFPAFAPDALAREIPNHTPTFVHRGKDMGAENPSRTIRIKVFLQKRNPDQLQSLIEDLHDPYSPNFRRWLTPEEFKTRFGATAADVAAVERHLTGYGLAIVSTDANNLAVNAQGAVADVQRAFHVQLHRFEVNGDVVRANTGNPVVDEPAGAPVSAVGGLSEIMAKPHHLRAVDAGGKAFEPIPLESLGPDGLVFSSQCFRDAQSVILNGAPPTTATYSGLLYGADIANATPGTLPPCAYQPGEVQTAYKLKDLYAQGLDGTGQTIVVVDAFGSTTIEQDLARFSEAYGLPAARLTVVGTVVPATNSLIAGLATETTLDLEWAHAVAPGASLVLVVAPSPTLGDLNAAVQLAVDRQLGNVISNSYGAPEILFDAADPDLAATESMFAQAAAQGISVHYSSGDDGDFSNVLGPGITTVSYPASSPLTTAIGGTSLAIRPDLSVDFQTGWGNNLTRLSLGTPGGANDPVVPPSNDPAAGLGFQAGSGGGTSGIFGKPRFQRRQYGDFRLVPDISWLADPFTGVEILQTIISGGRPVVAVGVVGGTSLACPMFSALWAIAAQAAGGPIGQAARSVYELNGRAIADVKAFSPSTNVSGVIQTPNGTLAESADDLSAPLFNQRRFVSALRQGASTSWFNLSFGTDSSLVVRNGWDNVTGLGTPNAPEFVSSLACPTPGQK